MKKYIYKENFMTCKGFDKLKLLEGIGFEPKVVSGKENFTYYVSSFLICYLVFLT